MMCMISEGVYRRIIGLVSGAFILVLLFFFFFFSEDVDWWTGAAAYAPHHTPG